MGEKWNVFEKMQVGEQNVQSVTRRTGNPFGDPNLACQSDLAIRRFGRRVFLQPAPEAERPEHNSGSDGESAHSQSLRMISHFRPVLAPAQTMVPVPPVQGPPPRLPNRLKVEGLRTIIEEKLLSTKDLEGRYSGVRDTLRYHRFDIFTRHRGPYIPTWVHEFYATFGELVPQRKNKTSAFKSVKSILVSGKELGCNSDHINATLDRATGYEHEYAGLATTHALDDLKG
uniref:Putative plant transposon protein domain-containing protein n=1 Tax=Solanum tuberosum TaxID=4113 RepID=M1DYP9_SOLTU